MCRLMGQLAVRPASLERELALGDRSLLAQSSCSPDRLQKDGWGIARYNGSPAAPILDKSPGPAFEEAERFRKAAAPASRVVIGHIRAASNPKGLPGEKLIGLENTQPFTFGRFVFAHNGTLNHPDRIAERLGPLRSRIRGVNDSEVFFYQWVKYYRKFRGDAFRAFQACLDEIQEAWISLGRPEKPPHAGLNVVASDGKALYAMCHYPATGSRTFFGDAPWGRMAFRAEEDRVIVSSERLEGGGWWDFADPGFLKAWNEKGRVRLELRHLRLPGGTTRRGR